MQEEKIVSYKGFDEDWKCRGFQYELGGTYEHQGEVKACGSGFHACEYPLDMFNYYPPATSHYAQVEQEGDISRGEEEGDSKIASRRLKIGVELSIAEIVKAAVEYTSKRCTPVDASSPASSTGNRGAASSTGRCGAASSTGDYGAASSTGYRGAALASGNDGAALATSKNVVALANGDEAGEVISGKQDVAGAAGGFVEGG